MFDLMDDFREYVEGLKDSKAAKADVGEKRDVSDSEK